MTITDRSYRTCTYIAGDWTGDSSAIEELHKWNESDHWGLSFTDFITSPNQEIQVRIVQLRVV